MTQAISLLDLTEPPVFIYACPSLYFSPFTFSSNSWKADEIDQRHTLKEILNRIVASLNIWFGVGYFLLWVCFGVYYIFGF